MGNWGKTLIVALAVTLLIGIGLILTTATRTPEPPPYDRWYIVRPTKQFPNFCLFDKETGALYLRVSNRSENLHRWRLHLPPPTPPTTTQPVKK
ncbi:MAG: hypothetical protein KAV00_07060 [Phycisphaerae bacterium]|nr:hypothetical protein [Phycisphaerae bacterium]